MNKDEEDGDTGAGVTAADLLRLTVSAPSIGSLSGGRDLLPPDPRWILPKKLFSNSPVPSDRSDGSAVSSTGTAVRAAGDSAAMPTMSWADWNDRSPILTELAPILTELAPILAEPAPILTELAPIVTELAPILTELAPILTELAPIDCSTEDLGRDRSPDFWLVGRDRSPDAPGRDLIIWRRPANKPPVTAFAWWVRVNQPL